MSKIPPKKCELCKGPITSAFVDGATVLGCWANMCTSCHTRFGRGLGTGKGQLYVLSSKGTYDKMDAKVLPGSKHTILFKKT